MTRKGIKPPQALETLQGQLRICDECDGGAQGMARILPLRGLYEQKRVTRRSNGRYCAQITLQDTLKNFHLSTMRGYHREMALRSMCYTAAARLILK